MDGYVTIGTKIDTKDFKSQISQMEDKLKDLQFQYDALSKAQPYSAQSKDLQDISAEIEKTNNGLISMRKKQDDLNKNGLLNVDSSVKSVKNSIEKTISKVLKLSLAIFGIRSAYLAVRKSAATLSEYNQQISDDLQYIQYALATAIQPIVQWLIQGAYTLLSYVNYIANAWFGINLFGKASVKNMNDQLNANKKNNKELKKTLASFDEINQLQDKKDQGSTVSPSFDLSKIQGGVPEWLKWIADNKDTILTFFEALGAIFIGIKIADFIKDLGLLGEAFNGFKTLLMGLGIGLIIFGIFETLKGIRDFIKDPSWNNFGTILLGLTAILAGVALAMLAVNAANPVAWIILAIAAIGALVALIIKNWDSISKWLLGLSQWIYDNAIKPVADFFTGLWDSIKTGAENLWNGMIDVIKSISSFVYKYLIKPISDFFSTLWTGIKNGIRMLINGVIGFFNFMIDGLNALIFPIRSLIVGLGAVMGKDWTMDNIKIPRINYLATGGIVDVPKTGIGIGGNTRVGEAGAEGVLPLTNPDTMAKLGQEIGKWITINMNLTNTLDGRVLSNRLEEIKNQNNFSRNGV